MSLEQSDIGDRLPLFEAYKSTIGDITSRAYDYIDPTITSMMTNCVPVGLRADDTLAIPKTYEPEDGPPVLMLRPGENVTIKWSDGMEKMLQHVMRRANVTAPSDLEHSALATGDRYAHVMYNSLQITDPKRPDSRLEPLYVPRHIVLRPQSGPLVDRSIVLLHECDHWEFSLNIAPLFSRIGSPALPLQGKDTLFEKRAYTTEYTNFTNTGRTGYFMTAESLADNLRGHSPVDAARTALDLLYRYRPSQNHMATVAVALSMCFGNADPNSSIAVSEDEVKAYRAAGLIPNQQVVKSPGPWWAHRTGRPVRW